MINPYFCNNKHGHFCSYIKYLKSKPIEILIVPFGGDTYKDDPDASDLCRCSLDIEDYKNIGELISLNFPDIPIVVTQEGGYNMENISNIVHSFLSGINE